MPYTVEQFVHDYTKEPLHTLTLDERLVRVSLDQRLQGFSAEEVLKRFSPEQLETYLSQVKGKLH